MSEVGEDRPHRDKPLWLLMYFSPCHAFGESYRRELQIRKEEAGKEDGSPST